MKAKLEFDLNDFQDRKEHTLALKGRDAYMAMHDIAYAVFRPARKHGYNDSPDITALLEKLGPESNELIGLLEDRFYEILRDREIDLDTLG